VLLKVDYMLFTSRIVRDKYWNVSAEKREVRLQKHRSFYGVPMNPDGTDTDSEYSRSVAIDGDLIAVGMGADGANGTVYLYKRQGLMLFQKRNWSPPMQPKLVPNLGVVLQSRAIRSLWEPALHQSPMCQRPGLSMCSGTTRVHGGLRRRSSHQSTKRR